MWQLRELPVLSEAEFIRFLVFIIAYKSRSMGFNVHFWPFRGVCHVYVHTHMHTIFRLFIACTNITAILFIGLTPCKLVPSFIVLNRLV